MTEADRGAKAAAEAGSNWAGILAAVKYVLRGAGVEVYWRGLDGRGGEDEGVNGGA